MVLVFHLVVAEREADSAAVLPRSRLLVFPPSLVFTGSKVPVGSTPAVVHHPVGNRGVVALEQSMKREGATAFTCVRPVDVIPEHIRWRTVLRDLARVGMHKCCKRRRPVAGAG